MGERREESAGGGGGNWEERDDGGRRIERKDSRAILMKLLTTKTDQLLEWIENGLCEVYGA